MSVDEIDLKEYGFNDNYELETKHHEIVYVFYDIGRLMINGKPKHTGDQIYIEDYFSFEKFKEIIKLLTGHELIKQ